MAGDRDPAGFDLAGRQPARLEGLKSEFPKGQGPSAQRFPSHPASLLLAEFDLLGHEHG
jgi:hypothetical protein